MYGSVDSDTRIEFVSIHTWLAYKKRNVCYKNFI